MLPSFFNTDMAADVEYVSRQEADGLHVTATAREDGESVGSLSYGPLRKLTEEEASEFRLETWGGTAPSPFQEGEAFEAELERGTLVIFVRWNGSYHVGVAVEG